MVQKESIKGYFTATSLSQAIIRKTIIQDEILDKILEQVDIEQMIK